MVFEELRGDVSRHVGEDDGQVERQQVKSEGEGGRVDGASVCLLYTSPSPRDMRRSRMPSSA